MPAPSAAFEKQLNGCELSVAQFAPFRSRRPDFTSGVMAQPTENYRLPADRDLHPAARWSNLHPVTHSRKL